MDLGCEFAVLEGEATINRVHTSKQGNPGPYPEVEEDKVTTVRRAVFLKQCFWKEILYYILCGITAGFYWLILHWYPYLAAKLRFCTVEVSDPSAEFVLVEGIDREKELVDLKYLVKDSYGNWQGAQTARHSVWDFPDGGLWRRPRQFSDQPLLGAQPIARDAVCREDAAGPRLRLLEWRHARLWYNPATGGWHKLRFEPAPKGDPADIHRAAVTVARQNAAAGGRSAARLNVYGQNSIEVEVQKFSVIFFDEAITPFVLFQIYSVIIWCIEVYITYSVIIVGMTLSTIIYSTVQIQKSQRNLRELAKTEGVVDTARPGPGRGGGAALAVETVPCARLAPGDLVALRPGLALPCDVVLLAGAAVVNEAMLTGESAPVRKAPLPRTAAELGGGAFRPGTAGAMKHLLLSGSRVLQAEGDAAAAGPLLGHPPGAPAALAGGEAVPALGMVLRAGVYTTRGRLVQALQYPQDTKGFAHRQRKEAEQFVAFLLGLTVVITVWFVFYAIYFLKFSTYNVVIYSLDLTTILVPAALPLVLSVGVQMAFESLKEKRIHAATTTHIVTAGHADCMAYDKTGTLTQEGDTFVALVPADGFEGPLLTAAPRGGALEKALAGCHSLARLERGGALLGESLELEMLRASGWRQESLGAGGAPSPSPLGGSAALYPPDPSGEFLVQLRDFPFDAETRTQSAVVAVLPPAALGGAPAKGGAKAAAKAEGGGGGGRLMVLAKGAPEAVAARCRPGTVPAGYGRRLAALARAGYRVLAFATKPLANAGAGAAAGAGAGADSTPSSSSRQKKGNLYRRLVGKTKKKKTGEDPMEEAPSPVEDELDSDDQQLIERLSRDQVEKDLEFCGFLLMGNSLKPETVGILDQLHQASLRQVMVTGDNVLTALSVAHQCNAVFIEPGRRVYILDYPTYNQTEDQTLSINFFSLTPSDEDDDAATNLRGQPASFQDALKIIQQAVTRNSRTSANPDVEIQFAVTGNAFSALVDLHSIERPDLSAQATAAPRDRRSRARSTSEAFADAILPGRAAMMDAEAGGALALEKSKRRWWPRGRRAQSPDARPEGDHTPLELVLANARVFARFKPHEKQMLMSTLQRLLGLYVCMVGDGANDSFALKTADVGLSISSNTTAADEPPPPAAAGAESPPPQQQAGPAAPSIAAPFSTPVDHIGAALVLLTEGRAALATSLVAFRYMVHYGVAAITQVLLLYNYDMLFSDQMWVWGDLFVNLPLAMVLNMTKCNPSLAKGIPETAIVSWRFAFKIGSHSLLIVLTQAFAVYYVRQQPWYVDYTSTWDYHSMEVTTLFLVSVSQYLTSAMALAHQCGGFRAGWWTNRPMVAAFVILTIAQIFFILSCGDALSAKVFLEVRLSWSFRFQLILLLAFTGMLHILIERAAPHVAKPKPALLSGKSGDGGGARH